MSSNSTESGSPRCAALVEQRLQVLVHIAAVVERRQRVENGHFDASLRADAQMVGIALALIWVRTRASSSLLDRADDIVVHAHVEAPQQLGSSPGSTMIMIGRWRVRVERANLRAQPQARRRFPGSG